MYYILSKQYYYIKVMTPRHIYLLTLVLDKLVKSTTYVCITRMHLQRNVQSILWHNKKQNKKHSVHLSKWRQHYREKAIRICH